MCLFWQYQRIYVLSFIVFLISSFQRVQLSAFAKLMQISAFATNLSLRENKFCELKNQWWVSISAKLKIKACHLSMIFFQLLPSCFGLLLSGTSCYLFSKPSNSISKLLYLLSRFYEVDGTKFGKYIISMSIN